MLKNSKFVLLLILFITFLMPWYNALGGNDVSGLTLVWEYRTAWLVIYNLAPVFAALGMYRIYKGKDPGKYYLLAGIPVSYFWIKLMVLDTFDFYWEYSYIGGKVCFLVSVFIVITFFIPLKTMVDFMRKQLEPKKNFNG
ncbi:hypothetical protein FZC84_15450 [Rossellomorea vietnamensis]|uniref:Uncharacterized protein n=1 Tax=Rossellomorea vietnamensis TaxID=218284 RepID=A0A5D4MAE7_9BACI|nr:hypothetical protein [Rossellomorea vietnamensis]TYR98303.1 hypothetical protein FZC84_15450 [Rossellomorea vietnamensis]